MLGAERLDAGGVEGDGDGLFRRVEVDPLDEQADDTALFTAGQDIPDRVEQTARLGDVAVRQVGGTQVGQLGMDTGDLPFDLPDSLLGGVERGGRAGSKGLYSRSRACLAYPFSSCLSRRSVSESCSMRAA
jgi:hypothetical protein